MNEDYEITEEVAATRWTCGGCGSVQVQVEDEEIPYGFHGDVMHIGNHGGTGGRFFACKKSCVPKAIALAVS